MALSTLCLFLGAYSWPLLPGQRAPDLLGELPHDPFGRTRTRPSPPSWACARRTAASVRGPSRDASPGTLTRTCGYFGIILAAAAIGTPCRFTAASSCRLVSTPSP